MMKKPSLNLLHLAALTTALTSLPYAAANADPWTGFLNEHGTLTYDPADIPADGITNITQNGTLYIGNNFNGLDILAGESVTITQPSTTSMFVAKDSSGDANPTQILGSLSTVLGGGGTGGSVMILDPNGVFFGATSVIDTGGIIASSGQLDNNRLINDGMVELDNFIAGTQVEIDAGASITVSHGGLAAFVAPTVVNRGIVTANLGRVELAGANTMTTIDLYGDGLLEIAVDPANAEVLTATNSGEIHSDGGVVHMTTGFAENLVDSVVNMDGIARVSSVTQEGGKIILGGDNTKRVIVDGEATANGATDGGSIEIAAEDFVGVTNTSVVTATGGTGDKGKLEVSLNDDLVINGTAATSIENVLASDTDVVLNSTNDIMADANIIWTGAGSLTLDADNDVQLSKRIQASHAGGTGTDGAVTINAGRDIDAEIFPGNRTLLTGRGDITLDATRNILLGGHNAANFRLESVNGNISLTAGDDISLHNTDTHAGNWTRIVAANGNIDLDAGNAITLDAGSQANSPVTISAQNGNITLNADGLADVASVEIQNGQIRVENAADGTTSIGNGEVVLTGAITATGDVTAAATTLVDVDAGITAGSIDVQTAKAELNADLDATTITGNATTVDVETNAAEIQDGVDVADTGATVNVGAGTYAENVTLNKAVSVIGAGVGSTVVDASGGTNGFEITGDLGANDVTLQDMSIEDAQGAGVNVSATANLRNLVIDTVDFTNNGLHGVAVFGDSVKQQTQISNANFLNNGVNSTSNGDGDILFYEHAGAITLQNVDVQGNTAGAADYGIQILGGTSLPTSGGVTMDNVSVSGQYRSALVGLQRFGDLPLTLSDVTLGGQTDAGNNSVSTDVWSGALFINNVGASNIDLGNTAFEAHDNNYIVLGVDSVPAPLTPTTTDIDATNATFLGQLGSSMTRAENFAVEDKVGHTMDFGPLGLVTWHANNLYVTQQSENNLSGAIQRGVDAASSGFNIFVEDGNFVGDVNIPRPKTLKIYGNNDGIEGMSGARNPETIVTSNGVGFTIRSDGTVIDGFTFQGTNATYGVRLNDVVNASTGVEIKNNIIKDTNNAAIVAVLDHQNTPVINLLVEGNKIDDSNKGDGVSFIGDGASVPTNARGIVGARIDIVNNAIGVDGDDANTTDDGVGLSGIVSSNFGERVPGETAAFWGAPVVTASELNVTDTISYGQENGMRLGMPCCAKLDEATVNVDGGEFVGINGAGIKLRTVDRSDITIENTDVISGATAGVEFASVENSNIVLQNSAEISTTAGDAVTFTTAVTDSDIDIDDNVINAVGGDGIAFAGTIDNADIDIVNNDNIQATENGIVLNAEMVNGTDILMNRNRVRAADNGAGLSVTDTTFGGTTVTASRNSVWETGTDGIVFDTVSNATIDDNNIGYYGSGLTPVGGVNPITGHGIVLRNNDAAVVSNNNIINTGLSGIILENGTDNAQILNNSIINAMDSGIEADGGAGNLIDNNEIRDFAFGHAGVDINGSTGTVVTDNMISSSNGSTVGIFANGANNLTIGNDGAGNIIRDTVAGVRVLNGTGTTAIDANDIADVTVGVDVNNTTGLTVTDNSIDADLAGSNVLGTFGIRVQNSNNVLIGGVGDANTITDYRTGVEIRDADNATVANNDISSFTFAGVRAYRSDDAQIASNLIDNGTGNGVEVSGGSEDATIDSNTITNVGTGIRVFSAYGTTNITNNAVDTTTQNGIHVNSNETVVINGNNVRNTTLSGIYSDANDDVTIADNAIDLTGQYGVRAIRTQNVTVDNNDIGQNGGSIGRDGISINGSNIVNPVINVTSNTINDTTRSGIEITNAEGANIGDIVIQDNVIEDADQRGIFVQRSGNVSVIENDLTDINREGIRFAIVTDSVIQGNTVDNNGFAGQGGISVTDSDNITIDSGNIVDGTFAGGINFNRTTNSTIADNEVYNTGGSGVWVGNSSNITISDNDVDNTGLNLSRPTASGITVSNTNDAVIELNTIDRTNGIGDGVTIRKGSQNIDVVGNIIGTNYGFGNIANDGVHVWDASNVTVDDNDIQNAARNGVFVEDSIDTLVSSNRLVDNNIGVQLLNLDGYITTVDGNTITDSVVAGINALSGDQGTSAITDNTLANNTIGVFLEGGNNIEVTDNNVSGSSDIGVFVEGSNDATIASNILNGNAVGLQLNNDQDDVTLVEANSISGSTTAGIRSLDTDEGVTVISDNDLDNNQIAFLLEGGEIDISDLLAPNTITGGETAMRFIGTEVSLTNDTLGTTIFENQSGNYVELVDEALFAPGTPTLIDGLAASWDGVIALNSSLGAGILPASQRDAIEARIIDFDDDTSLGQIIAGLTPDFSEEDVFALGLFSLSPDAVNVNVQFNGLPPVTQPSVAALAALSPDAGDASDFADIEPAAGGAEGCWASVDQTEFDGAVNFNFGGNIESALDDSLCASEQLDDI